ncbi:zinc finger domain-containing protein [Streptomyces anandii]|uniref:zinc finger domain-containing protein n=1 Tax=Streptomyces anandii TaxID=285454 RepID=UPI0037AA9F5E
MTAQIACPACHATPGTPCSSSSGHPMPDVHRERAQDAAAAYTRALEDASHDVRERRR